MKELSIEEKAQRYDEALKKAKDMLSYKEVRQEDMEYLFPELKESDDERMIQYFKDLAPFDKADELYEKYGFSHKDAISWLEKQGEHAKFRDSIQVGDKVTRNEDGVLVNLSQLNRVAKKDEKQGEQKPAWSEEDEKMINYITIDIEELIEQNAYDETQLRKEIDFLKSLKDRVQPQNTWKPSKEQIRVVERLRHCLLEDVRGNDVVILDNLLEQLKAL